MVKHIHEIQLRMASADFRTEQFINQNIVRWTESTILDSIRRKARREKAPDSYINALKVIYKGWMRADVELDYNKDGKPLGLWFEFGTPPHEIKGNPTLTFFWKKVQKVVTFGKVSHPGQKGKYIMTKGYKNGKRRLREVISTETTQFLEETKIP